MKRKAIFLGLVVVAAAISTLALSESRYKVIADDDVAFCYKTAYYHLKDASFMIPVSVYQEDLGHRNLRILHRNEHDKWVNSDVSCNILPPLDDIPPHERMFGVTINGEPLDVLDMIAARKLATQ